MWRHGDVLIAPIAALPAQSSQRSTQVLVHGELTGHSHKLEDPGAAEVWECLGEMFLRVTGDSVRVIHEEHAPVTLPRGVYRIWQQREYTPQAIRRVVD